MSYLLKWLEGNVPVYIFIAAIVITSLIEISPLKLNPWTWLKMLLTSSTRVEAHLVKIDKDIANLKGDIDSLKSDIERDKAIDARIRILSFGENLVRKGKSTKERYDQTMDDIDTYEKYCTEHPEFKNNRTVQTKEYIKEKYHACLMGEEEFLPMFKK